MFTRDKESLIIIERVRKKGCWGNNYISMMDDFSAFFVLKAWAPSWSSKIVKT